MADPLQADVTWQALSAALAIGILLLLWVLLEQPNLATLEHARADAAEAALRTVVAQHATPTSCRYVAYAGGVQRCQ